MIPVIAIVGRPNVGKSTLFNRLTRTRNALVADFPGVTRDRQYGHAEFDGETFIVVDTGGIGVEELDIDKAAVNQAQLAIDESDLIFFVVDGRAGLSSADEEIAHQIRQLEKPVFLLVNKTDGIMPEVAVSDFFKLGFQEMFPISASHGHGMSQVMASVLTKKFIAQEELTPPADELGNPIKIAFIGKPNVGKSTLINRILGEERVIVFDEPGTTRDSIFIPFQRAEKSYILIDTAGVRRRKNVTNAIEKFSIIKTLQAIEEANVILLLIDAHENISDQDLRLLSYIIDAGKAFVMCINKWDGMTDDEKNNVKREMDRRLDFVDYVRIHFISALHGSGVGLLYGSIQEAYQSATRKMSTNELTSILSAAMIQHAPPLVNGRRIKLRLAHPGGSNPPIIVIHGNQTNKIDDSYKRYLISFFRKRLKLMGTPIRLEFKTSENPFKNKKNPLTERQVQKRRRLMKHIKKGK